MTARATRNAVKSSRKSSEAASRTATATDVKRLGWRGILALARENGGELKITNHKQVVGAVLTPEAYETLHAKAHSQENVLERSIAELSAQFDVRLASLRGPEGAARLRKAISTPVQLRGKVKAGDNR